jgi:hypothetical protein
MKRIKVLTWVMWSLMFTLTVTDCNRNRSGLQSARFWDHITCLYRHGQDHIICL